MKNETSIATTIKLPVNNPYSIAGFDDYLTEVSRRFNVEKNAKNEAYHFIASKGLFDEFVEFNLVHRQATLTPHV
jgi:muramidase (phage lysozyme)